MSSSRAINIGEKLIGDRKRKLGDDDDGTRVNSTDIGSAYIHSTLYRSIRYDTRIVSSYRNDSGDTWSFRFSSTVRITLAWTRTVSYDSYRESYDTEITGLIRKKQNEENKQIKRRNNIMDPADCRLVLYQKYNTN
jgi:hypothetical protein